VSDELQLICLLIAAASAAAGLVVRDRTIARILVLASLAAALAVMAGLAWNGPLAEARDRPALLAAAVAGALVVLGGFAALFIRYPTVMPLFVVAALPFRIPLDIGGETFNLLIPLYLMIGAAAVAGATVTLRAGEDSVRSPIRRRLDLVLALSLVVYALQSLYADDVTGAARNTCFFLVPFAALYSVLVPLRWNRRLLLGCLGVVALESVLFAGVGIVQQAIGEIFWNPALAASNDFHLYFRTNSLFWDPNIYGRYLAFALTLIVGLLVWVRARREALLISALIAFIWVGLLFAWSQSSFVALVAGLLVVIGLRYSVRWAAVLAPLLVVVVVAFTALNADGDDSRGEAAAATSGRTSLVSGGLELAADRPVLGWGSGSFPEAFARQEGLAPGQKRVSHNEVITVAAEQGLIGLFVFGLLIAVATWTLLGGLRARAPGLGGDPSSGDGTVSVVASRIALAAGSALLFVHAMGYAGLLSDTLTWALVACGVSLATADRADTSESG